MAQAESVSCRSAGNCSGGGDYTDGSGHFQAFVVSEANGTWHAAIEVPGTAALNQGGYAAINSVSCGSVGNCSGAGSYTDGSGHLQVFVTDEVKGSWGTAVEVPGSAALNQGGSAGFGPVSCASPGSSAGGAYAYSSGGGEAFVVGETNGSWGTAEQVPGIAALNGGGYAAINSVSCTPAGHCSAGGYYRDSLGRTQAFVVNEASVFLLARSLERDEFQAAAPSRTLASPQP